MIPRNGHSFDFEHCSSEQRPDQVHQNDVHQNNVQRFTVTRSWIWLYWSSESVFVMFVILSFVCQVVVAPVFLGGPVAGAVESAMYFVVPGQRALSSSLSTCALDGGRIFASAFAWLLAIIFVASAASRIGLVAGIVRLERVIRPAAFGPTLLAALYGIVAIVAFQLLFVGSAYPWLACNAFTDITGSVLIGLAPLMLAYLIVAALATLRASGPAQ